MNWIERMYELKGRDLYSQNGEGLYLEYVIHSLGIKPKLTFDIGAGDGFNLSNSRHLLHIGVPRICVDKETGNFIDLDNCIKISNEPAINWPTIISMDTDGNDYWFLDKQLPYYRPLIVIAEFNASYTDSRTIAYNPNHEWAGDDYYGFTFEAGVKLAEKHGYKVIFQIADMNMIMVRKDLIEGLAVPPVTYKQNDYFKMSDRTDWVTI